MSYVDIFLLLLILVVVWAGYRRGFIRGAFDVVSRIGSILLALWLYRYVADLIADLAGGDSIWIPPLAFLATLFTSGKLLRLIERRLLRRIPSAAHAGPYNRMLGILPGLVNGVILAAITSALLLAIPLSDRLNDLARRSPLVTTFASYTDKLEAALAPAFDEAIARTLNRLTVTPESSRFVKLPFATPHPTPRPDLEAAMLRLLNRERRAAGLPPLLPDTALRRVAQLHSTDMFARGYFSHITPEGDTPFDRIRRNRIRVRTAGENLALAPTLTMAHEGLMNSPGHRANILRSSYGRVGIGIMDGGRHGLMVTQNFRD